MLPSIITKNDRFRVLESARSFLPNDFNAEAFERAIFCGATRSSSSLSSSKEAYFQIARRLLFNACVADTQELKDRLSQEGAVFMEEKEIRSKKARELLNKTREEHFLALSLLQHSVDSVSVGADDGLECRSCKSNKITVEQRQTRSADEGFTVFFTCVSCGQRWRVG